MAAVITARYATATALNSHFDVVACVPRWGAPIWSADNAIEPAAAPAGRPRNEAHLSAVIVAIAYSLFRYE
jgi:hypothetical protein